MSLVDTVRATTWLHFDQIDTAVGAKVWFASETEQVTGSFKYRAATSVVQNVESEGFIAASSGNFGQALACACRLRNIPCIIVMPTTSAQVKIDAVRSHDAEIIFVDTTVQTRADKVREVASLHPTYHIASPYDCEWVIRGNSSLGHEIHKHISQPDLVLVPIGGGGLISGIAEAFEQSENPVRLWGVEPAMADDAARSLEAGKRLFNEGEPQTLADGARTRSVGAQNWIRIQRRVSNILRVSEQTICQAMRLLHREGIMVEPTGALTLASLLEHSVLTSEVVIVISGKNVDSTLYDSIIQRDSLRTP